MIGKEFKAGNTAYLVELDTMAGTGIKEKRRAEVKILSVGRKYVTVGKSRYRFEEIVTDFPVKGILVSENSKNISSVYEFLCSDMGKVDDVREWFECIRAYRKRWDYHTLSLQQLIAIRQILDGDPLHPVLEQGNIMLSVPTEAGKIHAKILPDKEYPGIALLLDTPGEPGAIMEYDPYKKIVQMRVYGKEDPDGDPIYLLPMSGNEK